MEGKRNHSGIGLFVFLFLVFLSLPTLMKVVHGKEEIAEQSAPTPDEELRSNEGISSKTDHEVVEREEEAINPDGFSVKEMKLIREQEKIYRFQAEVNKLMNIIVNSLYSNREVFLRELISNASDALDKIRFLSLTDPSQLDSNSKLEIKIKVDKEGKTLQITDTGIGMTQEELTKNLGTIAKSGTTEFLESFQSASSDTSMIGQFGVGFYSAFLVADHVTVISKHNNETNQYVWQSDAQGSFTISEDPRGNTLGRGTSILLHLKEDALDFLEEKTIKNLVEKYSEFITFPIYLWETREIRSEVPLSEEELDEIRAKEREDRLKLLEKKKKEKQEKAEENEDISMDGDSPTKEEEPEETIDEIMEKVILPKTKTLKENITDWYLMNESKPIWTKNPKNVTESEYNSFYTSISKDEREPLSYTHFSAEGDVEFKSILYIPPTAPTEMFDAGREQGKGIKLYVRRVFITDNFKDMLPKYLSFIRGVVDSDDLPLNISREMLQEDRILELIKKKVVRKVIALFQTLAEEDEDKYLEFWKHFGTNIKIGIVEDSANRSRLSKLAMFLSSKTGGLTFLEDYVSRMKEGQNQIYYLAGERKEMLESSPLLERLVKRGYEVLFMTDAIDEYAIGHLEKFDGKFKLTNIGKEGLTFDGEEIDEEKEKEEEERYRPLLKYLKKTLGTKIERAEISHRLTDSPSAMVSSQFGWTANMERIMKAQTMSDPKAKKMYSPRKILEINPNHPIIMELNRKVQLDEEDQNMLDIVQLLYETAALTSGFSVEDPSSFSGRIVRLLNQNLELHPNDTPQEEQVPNSPINAKTEIPSSTVQQEIKDEL